MEDSEKAPLIKRTDFREVSQPNEPTVVECCCVESTRLGRVPIIRSLFKKKDPSEKGTFSSSFAVLLSMLGSVVGTGNIWRFPRIVANNATEGGALAFLLVWFAFLWLWSMPIILIEYGIGRFTKKSTVESYNKLIGPAYRFMGGFQAFVGFCLGSYYSVLVGWCGYYFIHSCANGLPTQLNVSNGTWNHLEGSSWPVLCHGISILLAALSVSKGVSTIEPVNKVIVPVLLAIVVFCFYWALYLPWASEGIVHMFSPQWSSLRSSKLWLDAISQNAWDTGAGLGTFLTYATFMKKNQGAVKLGFMTPFFNNIVSLMCGILVFATVFSVQRQQGATRDMIVSTLQYNGPGNTGLTFIWMPLLFGSIKGGRFLAISFFLCLSFAGISSLIALMELPIHVLTDYGFRRIPATVIVGVAMFSLGLASAIDSTVLVNQDSVWAYAMILSGCLLLFLVVRYGILSFRKNLYNKYGIGDWPLPWVWVFIVLFIAPIEGVGLIIWWIVESIINNPDTWWQITEDSLATVLTEWALVMLVVIGLNWWMYPIKITEPKDPTLRLILGAIFNLSPRVDPPTPPPVYTPKLIDSSVSPAMSGDDRIALSPREKRKTFEILSADPSEVDPLDPGKVYISDVEL